MVRRSGLIATLLVALGTPTHARDDCEACPRKISETFTWENDGHAWVLRNVSTDHFYTNGLRLQKLWEGSGAPRWARGMGWPLRKLGEWAFPGDALFATGYTLGQNQYTPSDLTVSAPIVGQRPYGAWLYVGANVVFHGYDYFRGGKMFPRHAHFLELDAGILGQGAGGRATQATAHKILNGLSRTNGAPEPKGWHNQVGNQPALQLSYRWARTWLATSLGGLGRALDLDTQPGFLLGNPFVVGAASARVRVGYNIPSDFGPPQHIPAPAPPLPGCVPEARPARPVRAEPRPPWTDWAELYVFAGVEGRRVVHNAFLDCSRCRDLYQIDPRSWVGDREVGVVLRVWKIRVVWRLIWRSAEFDTRPGAARGQVIGSWNVAWVDFRSTP